MNSTLTAESVYSSVTNTSQQLTLFAAQLYEVISSTNAWIKLGADPTAVASTADNHYLPANVPRRIATTAGNVKLAIIRDTADGHVTASLVIV